MSLETSASESGEKYVNEFMFAGKMCLTDCGVEKCAVKFVFLLMKNVAKSMKEDKGGRKCFKEPARVSDIYFLF